MKILNKIPILNRLIEEDKGQALVFTAVILTAFLGLTGMAVDAGKGYYAFDMLRASTNAAALAGAAVMPVTSTATTAADDYGSGTSGYNKNSVMNSVNETVSFECLTSVTNDFYAPCENTSGGSTGTTYNAIQVNQTAKVPTWIGPLFGMPTFNISATATASMKGGTPTPYNIAIILDTTSSMTGKDDGKNNTSSCTTQIQCAELGIQTFLGELVPGTANAPIDLVSLYVFPGATSATMSNDYACNGSNPSIVPYTFTAYNPSSSTSSLPTGDTYNVVAWSNDYKSGAGSGLSSSSNLVKAVGGVSGCGAGAPGGEGTYYAQIIYVAQADLVAEQKKNGNANMMIILSDGDATACNSQSYPSNNCGSGVGSSGKFQIEVSTCPDITNANGTITSAAPCTGSYSGQPLNGTFCSKTSGTTYPNCSAAIDPADYTSYTYPSALGLCGQAVHAAQFAAAAGTKVYAVGYGTETQNSCTTDSTYSYTISGTGYGANSWGPGDQACAAIGAMASQASYFFSDDANGCSSPDTNNAGITSLVNIFSHIGANISSARLIPNNAT